MTASNAIEVTQLGKMYRIKAAGKGVRHNTLRDKIADVFKNPLNAIKSRDKAIFGDEAFWAVKNVSFDVSNGEVLGIIGVNGAGKSTLLKLLCRVTTPTTGKAIIRGSVGTLLEVGTGFNHELTGRENTYLSGAILGMKKSYIDSKFDEIVAFSGVSKFIDTPVKRYSSGMLVRLGFAVAAHLQPDILLVDEVLAVGDAKFRKKCLGKMHDVANQGRTVIFVSHNMRAISSLCNRVIRMHGGQIVDQGNPAAVVDRYLNSGDIAKSNASWDPQSAPGNQFASITHISVLNSSDSEKDIAMEDPFDISVNFENHVDSSNLAISLHLYNEQGDLILNPSSGSDELVTRGLGRGLYQTKFSFPGNVLNSGRYLITLLFVEKGGVQRLWLKDLLTFQIKEKREKNIDEWFGRNPGLIALNIPSKTDHLPKQ